MRIFNLEVRRAPTGLSPVYQSNKGSWWPFVREPFTGAWQRNMEWTTDSVLAHHAVYACITRIAQDFGKLRPKLVEQDEDGIWSEVTNAAHSPVLRKPNRFQNHIQFKEWWITSKLIHGNAYALLERDDRSVISSMYLLDPTRVQVLVAPDGAVFYKLKTDNIAGIEEDEVSVPASEIIHDRINCLFHPLIGTSPIFACGQAANLGLQIEKNSTTFFGNASMPSGILSSPLDITPTKSEELSTIWNARFGPGGKGGVAVLGSSMKFEQMTMTAHDAQLIEQQRWSDETVCSTFHVPPWKIGVGEQPAYTKPEIANQAYYSDCLQSPIEQWELCMDFAFGFDTPVEDRMLGVELDLDGLLRMDVAAQYTAMVQASGGAVLTPDEARSKIDLGPLPGGGTLYRQQQEFSLEALAKRDEKADPFGTTPPPPPALPSPEPQKALPAGDTAAADTSRSVEAGWFVREYMDKSFEAINANLNTRIDSLASKLEARSVEVPALPAPVEEKKEDDTSLEMWDGWFARDALVIVREAQALELQVVQDSIELDRSASVDRAVEAMSAPRETTINVAPAQVTVEQPDIHVSVTIPPEQGKTVKRFSKVIRDDVGSIIGVETTEE